MHVEPDLVTDEDVRVGEDDEGHYEDAHRVPGDVQLGEPGRLWRNITQISQHYSAIGLVSADTDVVLFR